VLLGPCAAKLRPRIPQIKEVIYMSTNAVIPNIINANFDVLLDKLTALEAKVTGLEKENTEIKTELKDARATISDQAELLANACRRINQLENSIYEYDEDEELVRDEDNKPVLIAPIATEKPLEETVRDFGITVHTTLELKASAIVEHLKDAVKPRNNEVFMNSREIIKFLKNDIDEDLRLKDIKNPRQAKKDILEKAVKLFSNTVMIVKNKSGNKVTGIALKPSLKRTDTYTC
jgi:hypothetical protein